MSTMHRTPTGTVVAPVIAEPAFDAQDIVARDTRGDVLPELLDLRGYRRPKATLPGYHAGRIPATKGRKYPPTPPTVREVGQILAACPDTPAGMRMYALLIVLYRAGLRISEALALTEHDLDEARQTIEVRRGKGGKARTVVMDRWAWEKLRTWRRYRETLPLGPIFCVVDGPTAGSRAWSSTDVRRQLRKMADELGIRKRLAPHQWRHACAIALHEAGVDIFVIAKMLGHTRTEVTALYLSAVSPRQMLQPVVDMPPPRVDL